MGIRNKRYLIYLLGFLIDTTLSIWNGILFVNHPHGRTINLVAVNVCFISAGLVVLAFLWDITKTK